ncbi:MAG: FecR domain-containing protein [Myxococcales bacterium]
MLNAPSGDRRVTLADGSSLSLSALSLARVSTASDSTRCVVEVGNVRFDVAPQKGRLFTVIAGAFEIRVVGTRFRVTRDAAGVVEVHVDHGVVRVKAPNRNAPIELEAGDRLRGDDSGISVTHPAPSSSPAAAESATPNLDPQSLAPDARKASAAAPPSDWRALYRERKYAAALASARQLGVEHLLDSLDARVLSDLADTARLAGDSDLALRTFASVERRFPGTPRARDALFLSGRIHATRGQAAAARTRFEQYLALNSHGSYAIEATGRLVELYAAGGDPRAKSIAKTYLELAPDGPYQRLCRSVLSAP